MEHKEEKLDKESIATATLEEGEFKNANQVLDKPTASESKGVLGSVWSAAGAIAESVQHAVQGTIDAAYQKAEKIQQDAHKIADKANAVYEGAVKEVQQPIKQETEIDQFLSSPTSDLVSASKPPTNETSAVEQTIADISKKIVEVCLSAEQAASDTLASASTKTSEAYEAAKEAVSEVAQKVEQAVQSETEQATDGAPAKFELSMEVVAHLQRIADRTGDLVLHDTARKAHSACAKGISEAPGVHLVKIQPGQATELVNLAIMTQDHELANFARYCQSVAATTQVGIEPYPGKIQEELNKGQLVLQQQGRVHTGPGYGAAFASVSRAAPAVAAVAATPGVATTPTCTQTPSEPQQPGALPSSNLQLTMDMVAHLQRIADRTGDVVLHDTARKAHSACAKSLSDSPGVHLVKILPDQATELVNLAIRTQDHELANFARYCQSVAATTQIGIEPSPGKILEEISKGRQELAQVGRTHTGPGYGAAFASVSRSSSQQNLSRSTSQQTLPTRTGSQQNITVQRSLSQQVLGSTDSQQQPQPPQPPPTAPAILQLTMEVVAHLQRIADRTGDTVLHDTARRAHSVCAKGQNEAPGVHLTFITPDQATELVNLAIRTQDHELANFARYCQSVAATTGVAVEPSPGKILQEIEKGRLELQQQGRAHTGPGYGAAFASVKPQSTRASGTPLSASQESISQLPISEPAAQTPASQLPVLAEPLAPEPATQIAKPVQETPAEPVGLPSQ